MMGPGWKILFGIIGLLAAADVSHAQRSEPRGDRAAEDWVYIENEVLKVGLLRSHGGALAYLSHRDSDANLLNHYDHGRLVQQSYYGDPDGSLWVKRPWRFNPVQGGDYKGTASTTVELRSDATSAYVKTIPRHWASGKLLDECLMEQWVELHGSVLAIRFRFRFNGEKEHQPHHQETPAMFVSPKLKTLVSYEGDQPWANMPLSRRIPKWPNESVSLAESWAAYVDDDGEGVGVFVPGVRQATCYRFLAGAGSSCSYIAPVRTFALKPGLDFSYQAYFTLGAAETIRRRFEQIHNRQD